MVAFLRWEVGAGGPGPAGDQWRRLVVGGGCSESVNRITLSWWSCGLMVLVLSTREQTLTGNVCAAAWCRPSSAGEEDCRMLSAEDAAELPALFLCTSLCPFVRRVLCSKVWGEAYRRGGLCGAQRSRGNSISFPRGGRVRLAGTSPAKCN